MSVDHKQSGVTRRDFVRIAVGSLVTLPSVAGGFIVPVKSAYAETGGETNAGSADDGTTKITLVFAAEVGFYVADVSEVETKPIAGARVKVTSRYNDKTAEGTTGKDGIVKLDIRNLAENYDNESVDNLSEYAFNATIAVTRDGYRDFECKLTRVRGGEGLLVPTRPLTDGLPYPKSVSFNEWDALYTENEFLSTPANTESHEFSMEWRQMPSNAATTVRIKDRETGEVLQQKTARPSGGTLKTSFTKPFLKKGGHGRAAHGHQPRRRARAGQHPLPRADQPRHARGRDRGLQGGERRRNGAAQLRDDLDRRRLAPRRAHPGRWCREVVCAELLCQL